MQSMLAALLLAVLAPALAQDVNPIGKVIELIDQFQAKTVKEGEEADKAYRDYVDWCDDTASEKRNEIKTATALKNKLIAKIGELDAEIGACDTKIEELAKSLAVAAKDLQAAKEIREKEAKEFAVNEAELMDTIDTLKRAISIVTKEMEKNPASLAQVDTRNFQSVVNALSAITDAAGFQGAGKQKLMALVQASQDSKDKEDSEEDPAGAPDAAVYKTHAAPLVELMEDLQEKAEEDLNALRKAEQNAKQNYVMLKQSLDDSTKNQDQDMADEKAAKSAAIEEKAGAQKDLAVTTKQLKDAETALADVKMQCMQVAADHEASVQGRNEELKAFQQAKKVLEDTTSGAVEQTFSFLQVQEHSRMKSRADLKRAEVLNLVKKLARSYHSSALAQLASRIDAVIKLGGSDDPFKKVKRMIEGLIAKLEAEAAEAAEEKAYCDDQMAKTEEKKGELEEDLSSLTAKIDKGAATSATLKNEVKVLQEELAAIAAQQAEMDKIRKAENEAYLKAKADLELGVAGVRKALSILRDYFGNKAASAMLQTGADLGDVMRQPAPPVMYKKSEGAGQGIIGILEVCESDFTKTLSAVEGEEADELAYYEKTTQENKDNIASKSQAVVYKVQEFKSLDKALADMASDKETKETQLKAVTEYYAKVKDRCIAKPESYEERKSRREAEIAGLKEALQILDTETALVQVRARRHRQQSLRH